MTKKHFIALADFVKTFNRTADLVGDAPFTENQINALANFCSEQNPNFNRERWLGYVAGMNGPNGGPVKTECVKMNAEAGLEDEAEFHAALGRGREPK